MRFFFSTPISVSLLVVLASATSPVAAQQAPAAEFLTACGPVSLRLRVANPDSLPGRVSVVRLATEQVLFTATYHASYGRRFDFAGVPVGAYLVRLRRTHTCYRVQMSEQAQFILEPAGPPLARR